MKNEKQNTYQSLIPVGVIDAAHKKPEWPQVLKAEFEKKVRKQNCNPHHQEPEVHKCTAAKSEKRARVIRNGSKE